MKVEQKRIMIIGAGILQVPAIVKAKEMGLKVIAIDMDPNAPGFKLSDESIQLSTIDIENSLKKALEIKPDAVMTLASDMPIRTVAAIGEKCNLQTISFETALDATDKGKMRKKLKKMNVPVPNFFIVSSLEQYLKVTKHFMGKFIVKPADNSGSRGIVLVEDINNINEAYLYAKKHSKSGEVLVEEYLVGPEVSVETLTINGKTHVIAITDKLTTGAPHFVEMGHSIPSQHPTRVQNEIKNLALAAIEAIGIDVGPSHTEIIVTPEGPKIVELGARLGGDNITTHLVPLATGIDMVEFSIRLALGEDVKLPQIQSKGAAIRYLKTDTGILKSVNYPSRLKQKNGVKEIALTKNLGDRITKIGSSNDRIGYVITQGYSSREAIEICEEALNLIEIKIIS
ncbi:ATP-grasp domain-containing protein [Neobacillus novalis]|uniref:ATP-grasp domain-containing protein n=1 Tax=Neobacillus novalis TaxID=220687 RepID=A0AA95MLA7_9BACI|nr:ATP-grasp domain-containing protein [Neobacillus novalis]WHY86077.1 ATP-grasp domain-containing protein [Neobacillus novalis]